MVFMDALLHKGWALANRSLPVHSLMALVMWVTKYVLFHLLNFLL